MNYNEDEGNLLMAVRIQERTEPRPSRIKDRASIARKTLRVLVFISSINVYSISWAYDLCLWATGGVYLDRKGYAAAQFLFESDMEPVPLGEYVGPYQKNGCPGMISVEEFESYEKVILDQRGSFAYDVGLYIVHNDYPYIKDGSCATERVTHRWFDALGGTAYSGSGIFCGTRRPRQFSINLSGPSTTKALPSGPPLNLIATVTEEGSPGFDRPVEINIEGLNGTNNRIPGITDVDGRFAFRYVPPYLVATQAVVYGNCKNCTNTDSKIINVSPVEVDPCAPTKGNPIQPGSGEKIEHENDWIDHSNHPLNVQRIYRSFGNFLNGMGEKWSHGFSGSIDTSSIDDGTIVINLSNSGKNIISRPCKIHPAAMIRV